LKKWTDLKRGLVKKEEGANRELPEGFIPGGFVTDIVILIWARKSPWRIIRGGGSL
jgi:hypothetical protein